MLSIETDRQRGWWNQSGSSSMRKAVKNKRGDKKKIKDKEMGY